MIAFQSRGQSRAAAMTIRENPRLEVVAFESARMTVTEEMRAFRHGWLGSRAQ